MLGPSWGLSIAASSLVDRAELPIAVVGSIDCALHAAVEPRICGVALRSRFLLLESSQ